MRELTVDELMDVHGAKFKIRINLGMFFSAIAVGAITGGPVGIGIALSAAVIGQGVNSLNEMYTNGEPY